MELVGFSIEALGFLFVVAIIAGILDTLAGGGGLLSLPALIVSGVPPLQALGTNKLQGCMGTATATFLLLKKKKVSWGQVKFLMLAAFIGSVLGTFVVQLIDTEVLNFVIPAVLVFIAAYFLLSPIVKTGTKSKLSHSVYQTVVVPIIGFYDGMFGPGTGSFFALAGISFRKLELIDATAVAKTLNFSTNFASLILFIFYGKIVWIAGLLMMLGQFIGAWIGTHCLFKINPQILRFIIVAMCVGMLIKYSISMGWLGS